MKPKIAFLYDFDKTLCTKDMQEYTFIPNAQMTATEFWELSNELSIQNKMDRMLSYMYTMLFVSRNKHLPVRRENFFAAGEDIDFFPGVKSWFTRMNAFGEKLGVEIEHYIISSGLKEIIEGSAIADAFKEVYACEFYYDENGVATWPTQVVNYTGKTQYLFRINKGLLDISTDEGLNDFMPEEERPIPFRNMVYFGDGVTDVPCMKLVREYGGKSIAVYPSETEGALEKVKDLLMANRINFYAPANYEEGSVLETLVQDIVKHMALADSLVKLTLQQKRND